MLMKAKFLKCSALLGLLLFATMVQATPGAEQMPAEKVAPPVAAPVKAEDRVYYLIGPGDGLTIFVWGNPDLSTSVTVRPDGMVSVPLIEDLVVTGKTPTQAARDIERSLEKYVKNPIVTVIMGGFTGIYEQQVRVVGEATKPQALPFRERMTLLDLMISVGGLTIYADGNKAKIVRKVDGRDHYIKVRIDDLLKRGDIKANMPIMPGDILIIPESWF